MQPHIIQEVEHLKSLPQFKTFTTFTLDEFTAHYDPKEFILLLLNICFNNEL